MALEELGATFSKLGQILSTRNDLLPPAYLAEFARLQDAAPTIPLEAVQETISTELDQPLEGVFATFVNSLNSLHKRSLDYAEGTLFTPCSFVL